MTLDDAIAILEQEYDLAKVYNTHMGKSAIKLGIEALKRIQSNRKESSYFNSRPLSGEK